MMADWLRAWRAWRASRNVALLVNKAAQGGEVIIVCGALNPAVYDRKNVVSAVRHALARQVTFKVLVGPEFDLTRSVGVVPLLTKEISIAAKRPVYHYAVVDGLHSRVEGAHSPGAPVPVNDVYLNDPYLAGLLIRDYNDLTHDKDVALEPLAQEGN